MFNPNNPMTYNNQGRMPYQMPQNPFVGQQINPNGRQVVSGYNRVKGRRGAEAFFLGPNQAAPLFDMDQPIFWHKETDDAGYPTLVMYSYKREEMPSEVPDAINASAINEIDVKIESLSKQIEQLRGVVLNESKPVSRESSVPEGGNDSTSTDTAGSVSNG